MAITRTDLTAATRAASEALWAQKDKAGAKFVLPVQDLGVVSEMLNRDNPFEFYSSGLSIEPGKGGVNIQFDIYADDWRQKNELGRSGTKADIKNQIVEDEYFPWQKPSVTNMGIGDFDLKRGVPNRVPKQIEVKLVKYVQNSIKNAMKQTVDMTIDKFSSSVGIGDVDITSRDKLTEFYIKFVQEVTKFVDTNEFSAGDILITIKSTLFDALATIGLIGDRATQTFATGKRQIGEMGGYSVQSGGMYLPATGGGATAPIHAFVGTNRAALHSIEIGAMNIGDIDNSSDKETHLEVADILGVPDYKSKFGKSETLVITNAAVVAAAGQVSNDQGDDAPVQSRAPKANGSK